MPTIGYTKTDSGRYGITRRRKESVSRGEPLRFTRIGELGVMGLFG